MAILSMTQIQPDGTTWLWGTTYPTADTDGRYQIGDKVWSTATPTTGQPIFWACSVSGTPGTWVAGPLYT